jgi:effector-binding domain-containing protein
METKVKYEIKSIKWAEKIYVTKREKTPFDKLTDFFSVNYRNIYSALEKLGIKTTQPPCAIYYSIDEVNKITDLAAAIQIESKPAFIKDFEVVTIPASEVITATHHGSFDEMMPVYQALDEYLKVQKKERKFVIEEYLTDPMVEKDPAKWVTNIYYVIK